MSLGTFLWTVVFTVLILIIVVIVYTLSYIYKSINRLIIKIGYSVTLIVRANHLHKENTPPLVEPTEGEKKEE